VSLFRRKDIDHIAATRASSTLQRNLGWPHLLALGVGAIVGTGIYTLTGVGAGLAGPGVLVSFVIAGAVCAFAALAYAELATMMPAAGSAYTYSYAVLGEATAWVIGWSLILEYTVVCSAVAVGWSAHAAEFIRAGGWGVSERFLAGPEAGGWINMPAVAICFVVAGVLLVGTRESAMLNLGLVIAKTLALAVFVILALPGFDPANFQPFAPHGFITQGADGTKLGIMAAASIIFFAFYGFDTISTAAEETKNPDRDLKIGILGSMAVCVLIYMAVAGSAIGAMAPAAFAGHEAPLVLILDTLGHPAAAKIIAAVAVVALPTVILAFMYGQSRIFFVMARDGLLPVALSKVSARSGTPVAMTLITALVAAIIAGLFPLGEIAALANAGTLAAFIAVAVCMMVLRIRDPGRARVFRAPVWWLVGPGAILGCLYLFVNLPTDTILRFFLWNALGLGVYFAYGRRASLLNRPGPTDDAGSPA